MGDKAELIASANAKFDFIPPAELIIYKSAQGNLDSGFVSTGGRVFIGGQGYYRVTVTNKTETPVTSATIIDVLPFVGDLTIAPDVGGVYAPRGSTFPVSLTGAVTGGGPASFAISYATRAPGANESPEDYALNAGWGGLPGDPSTVRAVKMVMTSGQLNKDQSATFTIPIKAPYDVNLRDGQKANNTAAVSTGGKFTESSASSLVMNNVVIKGTAFRDYNQNGLRDGTTESGIAGVTARLMVIERNSDGSFNEGIWVAATELKADGTPDASRPITAVTDVYGNYQMEAYYAGTYKVVFDRPANHAPTIQGKDPDPVASHIIQGGAVDQTNPFPVNTTTYRYTRNAGYVYNLCDLKITKQLRNRINTVQPQGTREFTYELKVAGAAYTVDNGVEIHELVDGVLTMTKLSPDAQGRFKLKNGSTAWIRGLTVGAAYQLTEIDAPLYEVTPASGGYSGKVAAHENLLPFVNKEIDNAQLTISKKLVDSSGNVITPTDRTFYFRLWTNSVGFPHSGASNNTGTFALQAGGSKTFTDLPYGIQYNVREYTDNSYTTQMPTTDYAITYSVNDAAPSSNINYATPSFENRLPSIEVINTEKPLGRLQISKIFQDSAGVKLDTARPFQFTIKGPHFPNRGKPMPAGATLRPRS